MTPDRRLIAAFGVVWLVLLAVSLDFRSPHFRPSDVLRDPDGPAFLPNQDVVQTAYGDLAYKNHLVAFQRERTVRFRTDAHGYRNPPSVNDGPLDVLRAVPRVVVLGDSFVIGVSLDDEQTLTQQLGNRLGEPVYNFGCYQGAHITRFLADERFRRAPPEVVVLMLAARHVEAIEFKPKSKPQRSAWASTPPLSWLLDVPAAISDVKFPLERDNGLRALAKSGLSAARYRFAGTVGWGEILVVEDEPRLALSLAQQSLYDTPEKRRVEATANGVARFRDQLAERGITLLFSQIPESGILYEDAFAPELPTPRPRVYDLLYEAVQERGVEIVDLLPQYMAARSPYLFLPADTHWNARCVELTADVLVERVRPLLRYRER